MLRGTCNFKFPTLSVIHCCISHCGENPYIPHNNENDDRKRATDLRFSPQRKSWNLLESFRIFNNDTFLLSFFNGDASCSEATVTSNSLHFPSCIVVFFIVGKIPTFHTILKMMIGKGLQIYDFHPRERYGNFL